MVATPSHQSVGMQTSIHKLEMVQHRAARFVLNKPWRRNHRDSITDMLVRLNWKSLENHRRHSRLILLFKFVKQDDTHSYPVFSSAIPLNNYQGKPQSKAHATVCQN